MRIDHDISTNRGSVVNYDLEVLVESFLNDPEVFRSYGFDNIYRDGFLDHDRWQRWQEINTTGDQEEDLSGTPWPRSIFEQLNALEAAYYMADDLQYPADLPRITSEIFEQDYTISEGDLSNTLLGVSNAFLGVGTGCFIGEDYSHVDLLKGIFP